MERQELLQYPLFKYLFVVLFILKFIFLKKILSTPEFKRELPGPVPLAVIIEPTRELCIQVYDQFRKFANGGFNLKFLNLKLFC